MGQLFRLACLIILLVAPFNLEAQSKSSFKKISRIDEVQSLLDSAWTAVKTNPSRAFDFMEKALSLSIKSGDRHKEALCYQTLGKINLAMDQPDLAISYFQKAINLFVALKDGTQLNATFLLTGDAYVAEGNTGNAILFYNRYLANAQKSGNKQEKKLVKYKIADAYYHNGEWAQALKIYNELEKEEKALGNQAGMLEVQNKIGQIYIERNQKDKALETYKKTEELAKSSNDKDNLSNSLKQQSSIYRSSNQYGKELDTRKQLLDLEEKDNNKKAVAEQNLEIGNIFITRNMTDKAIPYINKSIEVSEEAGSLQQKGEALQSLSTAYSKNAQFDKALEVYREYVETVDAIYRQKEEENKASIQLTASLNRKIQRLDLIEKELNISNKTVDLLKQEQLVSQKSLRARKIFNVSLITVFVVLTVALLLIYRSSLQKRKANQMLALKSLRSQMNPHFIYNSLNSVNNFISKNDEKAANKFLSEFSLLMRAVMENSKHDFVTLANEIQIIERYLLLEHSRFGDKFDYKLEIAKDIDLENISVPPMLIQPFVENAIWHGLRYLDGKGFLHIALYKDAGNLIIRIDDNGIGRKKSEESKTRFQKEHVSTGLINIHNRVKIINDLYKIKLDVEVEDLNKSLETGTSVKIAVPVNRKDKTHAKPA